MENSYSGVIVFLELRSIKVWRNVMAMPESFGKKIEVMNRLAN